MGGWGHCGWIGEPRERSPRPGDPAYRPHAAQPLKLSIAAYSYRDHLTGKKNPKLDLFDFVNLAADMALDGVEPTSYYFPPDVTSDYLDRLKLHAFSLGLDISGTAVGNNFCLPPGRSATSRSGSSSDGSTTRPSWTPRSSESSPATLPVDRPRNRPLLGPSKVSKPFCLTPPRKGSCWLSKITAGSPGTPEQILKLVKAIDSPNFGVNLDTGNFRGADPYAEIAQLAPYAMNVQVKTEIQRGNGHAKEEADLARIDRHLAR